MINVRYGESVNVRRELEAEYKKTTIRSNQGSSVKTRQSVISGRSNLQTSGSCMKESNAQAFLTMKTTKVLRWNGRRSLEAQEADSLWLEPKTHVNRQNRACLSSLCSIEIGLMGPAETLDYGRACHKHVNAFSMVTTGEDHSRISGVQQAWV